MGPHLSRPHWQPQSTPTLTGHRPRREGGTVASHEQGLAGTQPAQPSRHARGPKGAGCGSGEGEGRGKPLAGAASCARPGQTWTPARARSGPHLALCAVRMQMPCPCRSNTAMRAACPASLQGQAAPPPAIVAGIGVPEGPPRLLRSFEWSSDVRRKVSALTAAKECGQTCQTSLRTKQEASFDRSGEKNDAGIGVFKAAAVSLHFLFGPASTLTRSCDGPVPDRLWPWPALNLTRGLAGV